LNFIDGIDRKLDQVEKMSSEKNQNVVELTKFAEQACASSSSSSSGANDHVRKVNKAVEMMLLMDSNIDIDSFAAAVNQFVRNFDESDMTSRNVKKLIEDVVKVLRERLGSFGSADKEEEKSEEQVQEFTPTLEGLPVDIIVRIASFLDSDEDWTPFCATCRYTCMCVNIHIQYVALVMRLVKFLILGQLDTSDDLIPNDNVSAENGEEHQTNLLASDGDGYPTK
jgi:hypothetical protein